MKYFDRHRKLGASFLRLPDTLRLRTVRKLEYLRITVEVYRSRATATESHHNLKHISQQTFKAALFPHWLQRIPPGLILSPAISLLYSSPRLLDRLLSSKAIVTTCNQKLYLHAVCARTKAEFDASPNQNSSTTKFRAAVFII